MENTASPAESAPIARRLDDCCNQLGISISTETTLVSRVTACIEKMGLQDRLRGKALKEQIDVIHHEIFGAYTSQEQRQHAAIHALPIAEGIVITEQSQPKSATKPKPPKSTTKPKPHEAVLPAADNVRLWDRSAHPNGGPRDDQNIACLTIFCAAPFALCPLDCLSTWGCADAVDCITSLPGKSIPCVPCNPNVKNPLWFCSEPLGWAASHGQLHTVMALVGNGANPDTKNLSGNNTFTDAERERHSHVIDWLNAWKAAGRPSKHGVLPQRMGRDEAPLEPLDGHLTQGCYIGACIVPIFVTTFWVQASSADEMTATGFTLCCPWSEKLTRIPGKSTTFKLNMKNGDSQEWDWHRSGCCFFGTPGWWALKIIPGSCPK